jgi:hypothetical protein
MSSTQFLTNIPELPDRKSEVLYDFITDNLNFIIEKKRLKYIVTPEMKQCIGYCTKNKIILHPIKKDYYAALNDCPVNPDEGKNKNSSGENKEEEEESEFGKLMDLYKINDTMEKRMKKLETEEASQLQYSLCNDTDYFVDNSGKGFIETIPDIALKTNEILDIYGITSYGKGLEYIKYNTTDSLRTKLRIIDCLWKVYSNNIDNVTDVFVDFYTEVARKLWAPDIYRRYYIYIIVEDVNEESKENKSGRDKKKKSKYTGVSTVIDDKIIYIKKNNQSFSYYKKEKINFFISKFINQSRIYEYLGIYLKVYQASINDRSKSFLYMKSLKTMFKKFVKSKILFMLS